MTSIGGEDGGEDGNDVANGTGPRSLAAKLAATRGRELDLVGVGEAMVELWSHGPLAAASSLQRAYGGDILNSLVMAARLGSRTGFVTRVGDDPFGPTLLAAWAGEGVDTSRSPLVEGVNGVYFISRLANGEREFSYRRSGSAAAGLEPDDVDESYLARTRVLLLSGVTQAISAAAQAATLRAATLARSHGVVVAFDPNYRPALWRARTEDGQRAARSAYLELLPFVDLLLVSEPEDLRVLPPGSGVSDEANGADSGAEAYYYRSGPLAAGVKRGADGGRLLLLDHDRGGGSSFEAPLQTVEPVDTTGAGDAWNAGLIHALLNGRQPNEAVRIANAVAAWKIARHGAVPKLDGPAKRSLHVAVEP